MWSMPKKPQRKPKPRATELSGSKVREASLSWSFSRASRRSGYLAAVLGVDAAVDHGLGRAIAGQRLGGGVFGVGDGVAHLGVLDVFDGGGEIAHLTGLEGVRRLVAQGLEISALQTGILASGGHHAHRLAPADGALLDAEEHHHAYIGVVLAVEDQRLKGGVGVAVGGGHVADHVLQHCLDVKSQLGGDLRRVHGGQADDVLHLLLGLHRGRRRAGRSC